MIDLDTMQVFPISEEAIGERSGYSPFFAGFEESVEDYRSHMIRELFNRKPEDIIDD